jgi:phage I-like protein
MISINGVCFTEQEIADLITEDIIRKKQENKMNKKEAIRKCMNTLAGKKIELGDIPVRQLVEMLEALGLIKFEDEKEDDSQPKIGDEVSVITSAGVHVIGKLISKFP